MKFEKETITKEVWVIECIGKRIPLEAISVLLKSVAISILIVLTYNIAQFNTSEYLKWNAFFHGNYDPETHSYLNCYVVQSGTSISWKCENDEKPNGTIKNTISVKPT